MRMCGMERVLQNRSLIMGIGVGLLTHGGAGGCGNAYGAGNVGGRWKESGGSAMGLGCNSGARGRRGGVTGGREFSSSDMDGCDAGARVWAGCDNNSAK